MTYTKFPRGSEWRKWDLHIHTPGTKKNDLFEGSTNEEKWEKYIDSINNSPEDISVIGITDYLSIDNYFRFKKFASDGIITKKFDLIIPNVELRVLPVTASSTPVNLHCIFNPEIENEIITRFLSKLKFSYGESDYSGQPDELRRLGRALPGNNNLDDASALKAGINQYVIEVGVLRNIFKNDKRLRENTIIVVSNKSNDGASGTTKHADYFIQGGSQLDATRWSIYQFSDAIFSSNEKDISYFTGLGPDGRDTVIEKCQTLMPCFHGCDAHNNSKIFKPDDNRYCWIKADPTFDGLKQTLYEPEDRIKIQSYKPDVKNDRFIISQIEFIDSGNLFGNQKILLNENLNAIIGGKSSGKSLLLYSAARSIDPDQVDKTSQRLKFEGYKFTEKFDFQVTWKNGEVDRLNGSSEKNHKITYIPQLYINHLVERNNKEDLNSLIENILLQDASFKDFFDHQSNIISRTTSEIDHLLTNYLQIRNKLVETRQKSNDIGKSGSITKGIESLKAAILAGQKASNLSEAEFTAYNTLIAQTSIAEKTFKDIQEKEAALGKIKEEVYASKADLLGKKDEMDGIPLRGKIDRILDEFTEVPTDVTRVVNNIRVNFDALIQNLENEISEINLSKLKADQKQAIESLKAKLKPYQDKIAGQEQLQKLTVQLQAEELKVQQALSLEKQLTTSLQDYKNLRDKTVSLLKNRFEAYANISQKINDTRNEIGTGIALNCTLLAKQEDFALYNQVNKASISGSNVFFNLFDNGLVKYEEVLKLYSHQLRVDDNKLILDAEKSIPLKVKMSLEEILRGITSDIFRLDYTVTYKGDDLLSMSPGKKGTVLLILFLQISSSEFPIFIDQPEDNLDNRTIYDLLCKMIKLKKKDRQIVIVSHNANLVIATDSENIIVANQQGQDTTSVTSTYRFEYVNGSLEHTFANNSAVHQILYQQGIKEHACDILEGGDEAFKQRERKYSIK